MDFLQLADKTIAVFGVANRKSVAWHIGKQLREVGANVVFVVRSEKRREEISRLTPDAPIYVCDVENEQQVAQLRDDMSAAHDKLDGLVLSQGLVLYKREEFSIEGFRRVVDVNLNSVMACCARFHEMLKTTEGSITVVSSVAAFAATKGNPAYNASKAGTLGLVRTLAQAWARDGIRVNGLAPGLVETKMTKVTTANPERLAERLRGIPAGRLGTPGDMAGVALFLASPMAAYVTGHTIVVDGGRTL